MKITKKWLEEKGACEDGKAWWMGYDNRRKRAL